MGRSKGVTIAVKIPINWESMTKKSRQRLRQIVGRDTRIIRSYLGIIEQHEDELLTGRNRNKINDGELDKLTLTALKVKKGYSQRLSVPHDMKERFPRTSLNELTECRKTAVSMYESYLELRRKRGNRVSRPCAVDGTRRIPRWVFSYRFSIVNHDKAITRWWLNLRDSLDSAPEGRRVHDRLLIPLKMSPFHINQIKRGEAKALQIFIDRYRKWWVTFAIRVDVPELKDCELPPAVLGIDLGIDKAACTTLATPTRVRETRYFVQKDKRDILRKYDGLVAELQHEMHTRENIGKKFGKLAIKLRKLRGKRERISQSYDRVLVRELVDYIKTLSEKYTLYVSLGRLKYIRNIAHRGNYKGNRYRGLIHSWAFSRITQSLQHNLAQMGWKVKGKNSRFRVVSEGWTSIMCWKCGSKGKRPKQNYFYCPSCGHKTNADRNGAINIAARLIMLTKSLHNVRGLGKWADAVHRAEERSRLKARKKSPSEEKSLLSDRSLVSDSRESAAIHQAQKSLLDFSDDVKSGDDDLTVERDAEILTVTGDDTARSRQEKEARFIGGNQSR